jgi:hypothetical protein
LSGISQKNKFDVRQKYSVKQVLEDIDYTEKHLTKFHPDPYRYISKDSLHAFVLRQKEKIDTPLTEMQIRFCIKSIVAKIGCGHTDVAASKKYTKAIKTINRPILPFNVFVTDSNRLFVLNNLSNDTTIKPGDEILSIDKRPANAILKTIYSITTSDGYNETHKKQGARYNYFKYYYGFCYGFKLENLLKIKHSGGQITDHQIKAISTLKDTLILPKKDSINFIRKIKHCSLSIIDNDKSVAMIDINAFKGRHWRSFFRKSFKDIKQKNITNLVIDLRDNGGGQITYGLNFLSYLVNKKMMLPFDRKPNLLMFNPKYKMNFGTRMTPFIFSTFMPQLPKHGRLQHYFIKFPKKRKAFKGNIYVLVNGKSFSMSGVSSTYLKYKANAIIIGEETGGNIAGSNAVISGHLLLPNSKIKVQIPMYHLYHDIDVKNDGHGLIPDYQTFYTKDDILNGTDVDVKKVLELIK